MRFEKMNENKIRITLNNNDFINKNIDSHTFMSNPIETQDFFLDCLKEAEKKIGFDTKNYTLRIEALAVSNGEFILTITRIKDKEGTKRYTRKIKNENQIVNCNFSSIPALQTIFRFLNFDNYCSYISFLKHFNININTLADYIYLYEYKGLYYLFFNNLNLYNKNTKKSLSLITEFGSNIKKSNTLSKILCEKGNLLIKHNALKYSLKYF